MSCDIAKLINEYELAAKKFRYSESQECFEQKCMTYEAIVKAVASLEAENVALKERLAAYEVGYDPATNPAEDSAEVFVKTDDGRQYYAAYDCPSDDSIARFIVLPFGNSTPVFSINDITRWFPLPEAPKEDE